MSSRFAFFTHDTSHNVFVSNRKSSYFNPLKKTYYS